MHMPQMSLRVSLLTAAMALALPGLAQAQTSPRDAMRNVGMLGTWANDCSQPSGEDNFYTVYAGLPNGNVRRTYYNTPDRVKSYNEYTITRAIQLPANQVSYRQEAETEPGKTDRIDVILIKDGDKYKIWSSVRDNGEVLVENGKFPKSGGESPWQTRCGD
jgi:hypothetical protein